MNKLKTIFVACALGFTGASIAGDVGDAAIGGALGGAGGAALGRALGGKTGAVAGGAIGGAVGGAASGCGSGAVVGGAVGGGAGTAIGQSVGGKTGAVVGGGAGGATGAAIGCDMSKSNTRQPSARPAAVAVSAPAVRYEERDCGRHNKGKGWAKGHSKHCRD